MLRDAIHKAMNAATGITEGASQKRCSLLMLNKWVAPRKNHQTIVVFRVAWFSPAPLLYMR